MRASLNVQYLAGVVVLQCDYALYTRSPRVFGVRFYEHAGGRQTGPRYVKGVLNANPSAGVFECPAIEAIQRYRWCRVWVLRGVAGTPGHCGVIMVLWLV